MFVLTSDTRQSPVLWVQMFPEKQKLLCTLALHETLKVYLLSLQQLDEKIDATLVA